MQLFQTRRQLFLLLLLLPAFKKISAQEIRFEVDRCGAVNRNSGVRNIHVDQDNVKWVGNGRDLYQVKSCNLGTSLELAEGQLSVMSLYCGNTDFRWQTEMMLLEARNAVDLSCAWYDTTNDWLWIGTKSSGLFQFKTQGGLTLIEQMTTLNSKLKSNSIASLYQDPSGTYWVGSTEGLLVGQPKKWKNELDGYEVTRVRQIGNVVYALADSEFWTVENGRFNPLPIEEAALEGEAIDFDIAPDGNLWILSRMLTRYDLNTDEFQYFSGPQYYTSEYGRCIDADQYGSIWVGTDDKGLYRIEKAATFSVTAETVRDASCTNGRDAVLKVTTENGKPPFTYTWSDPTLKGEAPTGVSHGKYTVTVTDFSGVTKTAKIIVANPQPQLTLRQRNPERGPGRQDGSAEVVIEGGVKPLQILWSNGNTNEINSQLAEGTYTVTVTDAKGCSNTGTVTVSQKVEALTVTAAIVTPISCAGSTAAAILKIEGGKPPMRFSWSPATIIGDSLGAVKAGTYQLTLTDALGQSAQTMLSIKQPDPVRAEIRLIAPASTAQSDGRANAIASGGMPPYVYHWDSGEKSATAQTLNPGTHLLTVTDANGCTGLARVSIPENIMPLTVNLEETGKIKCNGDKSAVSLQIMGGKEPFIIQWSDAKISGQNPPALPGGDFKVTVTDATQATATATIQLREPEALTVSVREIKPATLGNPDGKAGAEVGGGTGKVVFSWDSGERGSAAVQLTAGTHRLTATDANGCAATATVDIRERIPELKAGIAIATPIACYEGSGMLQATVEGGKPPYRYQWTPQAGVAAKTTDVKAGNYTVVITDADANTAEASLMLPQPPALQVVGSQTAPANTDKNDGRGSAAAQGGNGKYAYLWDNGEVGSDAYNLSPGAHSLTVTDVAGCKATTTIQITENILPLVARIEETGKIKCAGNTSGLRAVVSGGKPPYSLQWNNNGWKEPQLPSAAAGTYQVTVTDALRTTVTASFVVRQPQLLIADATVMASASTGNSDGKATVVAMGGVGRFTYRWDNGETNPTTSLGLPPGTHTVTVTDGNNCQITATVTITENILPLSLTVTETASIRCAGELTTLKAVVSGGKPPYDFQWSENSWSGTEINGVSPGSYRLDVTDLVGTTRSQTIVVKGPSPLKLTIVRSGGATTERSKDGWATVAIAGGTEPYLILWDNGESLPTAAKLTQGEKSVTVTDAQNCSQFARVNIGRRILTELSASNLATGRAIKIEQLNFDADSSNITPVCYPVLDELADFLQENGSVVIELGGHTSSNLSDTGADRLSTARAKAAADYLINKGVSAQRVVSKGYGKRKPVASNNTPEGRKLNQRVEIKLLEIKGQ
jgi:outer membrane protein OmpA-like peptidoglycan-associated protein